MGDPADSKGRKGIERPETGPGSLYVFMRQNHADISREFGEFGVRWSRRAEDFRKAGLQDERGQPPTVKTAQDTWYRVCRVMKREIPAGQPPAPAVPPKREGPLPAAQPIKPKPALEELGDGDFTFAGLQVHRPKGPAT